LFCICGIVGRVDEEFQDVYQGFVYLRGDKFYYSCFILSWSI